MAKMKGLTAKVEKHGRYKTPRRIYDIKTQASKKSPRKIAEATLKKIAGELKIRPDLSQLKFDKVKESILGSHVLFQQYHAGKQISGAWVRVDIDKDGRVFNIQNDLVPEPAMAKARTAEVQRAAVKQLSASEAKAHAIQAVAPVKGDSVRVVHTELCFYPHNGVPTPSWKVIVKTAPKESQATTRRPAEWKMYIDAETGAILEKRNLLRFIDGKGRVFDPNPVVTLNDTSLEDKSTIPDKAYADVILRDLKASGFIEGPYVTTKTTKNRIKRKNRDFRFKRTDRAFKEVMVYFHIDRVQRHLQEMGFKNVLNRPIAVNIDGQQDDNSHYSPSDKDLTFGTGGVDDAEDAEIILHEYGHAFRMISCRALAPAARGERWAKASETFWRPASSPT